MANAFSSSVCNAVVAFSWISLDPLALTHRATSSIAEARACWLCRSNVSASAVAMLASELVGTVVVLE